MREKTLFRRQMEDIQETSERHAGTAERFLLRRWGRFDTRWAFWYNAGSFFIRGRRWEHAYTGDHCLFCLRGAASGGAAAAGGVEPVSGGGAVAAGRAEPVAAERETAPADIRGADCLFCGSGTVVQRRVSAGSGGSGSEPLRGGRRSDGAGGRLSAGPGKRLACHGAPGWLARKCLPVHCDGRRGAAGAGTADHLHGAHTGCIHNRRRRGDHLYRPGGVCVVV